MIGGIEETSASFEARSAPRSYPTTLGQTEKNSVRANVFRVTPESGHCSIQSACRKRARSRSRTKQPLGHHRPDMRPIGVAGKIGACSQRHVVRPRQATAQPDETW